MEWRLSSGQILTGMHGLTYTGESKMPSLPLELESPLVILFKRVPS